MYMYVCTCVCVYGVCMYDCMYVRMYVCIYDCMYVCMYDCMYRVQNNEWTVLKYSVQQVFGHLQKYMANLYNFVDLV